ncbi:monocarboxylate transporter 14-like [Littorina saxatilis]|uniref:Uncharacterized protein n=1 Tax=Littorina saxatilis TaxID=31220 RepID=A0AAN9G8Q1_9CAEN
MDDAKEEANPPGSTEHLEIFDMNLEQNSQNGDVEKSTGSAAYSRETGSQEEEADDEKDGSDDDGVPYDRGWAWVVLIACFMNYVVLAGYIKSLSVFYVALLNKFHTQAAKTALIFSIRDGVFSVSSLFIMNTVVGRLGIRRTVMIGALLMSLSGILSSLVTEMLPLVCIQGSLFGLGHAMLISPGEVLMGSYFRKRRSLALPLAKCGSSVGNMLMPPLVTFFLQHYGLSGALLLTGALGLHCLPSAMLLRPIESYHRHRGKNARAHSRHKHRECDEEGFDAAESLIQNNAHAEMELTKSKEIAGDQTTEDLHSLHSFKPPEDQIEDAKRRNTDEGLCEEREASSGQSSAIVPTTEDDSRSPEIVDSKETGGHRKENSTSFDCDVTVVVADPDQNSQIRNENERTATDIKIDINKAQRRQKEDIPSGHSGAGEDTFSEADVSKCYTALRRLASCPRATFCVLDFSLFASPLFRLLLAFFVLYPCINIMISYLPALASERGIPESQAALLLTIIGALDFFCRLCCAFIANSKKVKVSTMIAVSFVILGVTAQFVRLMTSWAHLVTLSVLLGMLAGVGNVLMPVLVVDFVGLDGMGKALGFVLLSCAAAAAAMFPLLGYIRDATGSYVIVYHVIGSGGIVAAGLLCCENWVRRLEHRQQDKHS